MSAKHMNIYCIYILHATHIQIPSFISLLFINLHFLKTHNPNPSDIQRIILRFSAFGTKLLCWMPFCIKLNTFYWQETPLPPKSKEIPELRHECWWLEHVRGPRLDWPAAQAEIATPSQPWHKIFHSPSTLRIDRHSGSANKVLWLTEWATN